MANLEQELKTAVTGMIGFLETRKEQIAAAGEKDKEKTLGDIDTHIERAKAMKQKIEESTGDEEAMKKLQEEWKAEAKNIADAGFKEAGSFVEEAQKCIAGAAETIKGKLAGFGIGKQQ